MDLSVFTTLLAQDVSGFTAVTAVAWRHREEEDEQVLLFTDSGVVPLYHSAAESGHVRLGAPLNISCSRRGSRRPLPSCNATCAACDGGPDVVFATETCMWRLDAADALHLVAGVDASGEGGRLSNPGVEAGGGGSAATFRRITALALGAAGVLYVVDSNKLRVVQLPSANAGSAIALTVMDVDLGAAAAFLHVCDLAYDHSKAVLYIGTPYAVLQVQSPHLQVLLKVSDYCRFDSDVGRLQSLAVTLEGELLVVNELHGPISSEDPFTYAVHPPGTPPSWWGHVCNCRSTLLPHGGVAFHGDGAEVLLTLMSWDVRASRRVPGTPPLRPLNGRTRLGADLTALLGPQPCSPPDLTLVIGGKTFAVHRALLSARSEYLARLFVATLSDSSSSNSTAVQIPGADPEAFEPLLSYMYGGELHPTPQLARPMAVLANRLLLPEASSHLQQQLSAATSLSTVVDDMLWAEQQGLDELLAGLKAFYLRYEQQVIEQAPGSIDTLMARSPKLHVELYVAMAKRARLR